MGPEAIVTIIGVALVVGALAAYLIIIAYSLYKVSFTLGTVLIGVRAIADQCEPLRDVVGSIADDVAAVEEDMARLAAGQDVEGVEEAEEAEDEYQEEDEGEGYEAEGYEAEGYEDEGYEVVEEVEVVEVERPRRRRVRARR
ncbi:MAG: hypothetical protein M3378_12220 [Actinomycetota bacterium]|nr:hypothetical protein [Actinomycetota bacterium]MDQ3681280.1 hypothetical protein [Actinomycetota bacterium]